MELHTCGTLVMVEFQQQEIRIYTYFQSGTYRIQLTVRGPGGTTVESQTITVYKTPRANFEVAPTLVFVNDEQVRGFNLSQYADTYIWEFGDGDTSHVKGAIPQVHGRGCI